MEVENTHTDQANQTTNSGTDQAIKKRPPRVVSHPKDVAEIVMMQIDAVSTKKDELTIAIKNLTDTTKQLARLYGQQTVLIAQLQARIAELEGKAKN